MIRFSHIFLYRGALRWPFIIILWLTLGLLLAVTALAQSRPDPKLTPGALNLEVTQTTISATICVRGWTRTVRPPAQYTTALKRQQLSKFGYADHHLSDFEEDHLIPLDLGGAPYDARNLWPQPRATADGWNADLKDELEAVLARRVCSRQVPLADAQQAIATDWIAAYNRFVIGEP
jgi:hypothetical protein